MVRLFDIVLALIGLLLLLPFLICIFITGLLDTGSPLFCQSRVGQEQRLFTLYKFRTMKIGVASVATHMADVSTITQYGRFLRRTKLDELPQLWNVLKGEMSLVGPRPCLPEQHELIEARRNFNVFKFRPGMTGLAQIEGIDMSTPENLAIVDAEMLKNLSLKSYFSYIIKTIAGKGREDRVKE